MKERPTRGPIHTSRTHHERDTARSRNSFSTSQRNGGLREGKEDLLQAHWRTGGRLRFGLGCQFADRPFSSNATVAQQYKTVAKARGVGNLVNRQEQSSALGGIGA